MAVPLPLALKAIQPFLKVANDMRKKDGVAAYYCDLHAMQSGMKIDTKSPDCKKFLMQQMSSLEEQKNQLSTDPDHKEAISSEVVGQTVVENQAMRLFKWADTKDRNSEFNKNVVRAFYTSAILFDVAEGLCEDELEDDAKRHRKYARWKATYIHNCLKNGETPQPGPIGGLEDDFEDELGGENSSQEQDYSDSVPSTYSEPPKPVARSKPPEPAVTLPSVPSNPEPSYAEEDPSDESELTPEQYNQAQKLCKYASSAIMYQDVPTALLNLEKCIRLLKTGKEEP